jgi:hypothetical protein
MLAIAWSAAALKHAKSLKGRERVAALLECTAPRPKTALDRGLILVDYALAGAAAVSIAAGFVAKPTSLLAGVLFLPLTLFIGDLIGQCTHKWLDSYASEDGFFLGQAAQEFRKHHEYPANLNGVGYLNHIAAFGKVLFLPFLGLALTSWESSPTLGFNLLFLLILLLNATEIHKQAHKSKPDFHGRVLQSTGLFLTFSKHARHHQPPFDSEFAVINGWSQILTDRFGFWSKMDLAWWRIFGELPRTWIQDPRAIPESVVNDLRQNPAKIPSDLLIYSDAYPERMPPAVALLFEKVRVGA